MKCKNWGSFSFFFSFLQKSKMQVVGNGFFFRYLFSEIPNFSYMHFFRKSSMFHQSIPLRSNDNKRIQSIDLIETYDYVTKKTIKEHNPNLTEISNHPHRILITGDSGSEKNKLFI